MPEIAVTEQVHLRQQELALIAAALDPELAQQYAATRAQLIREIDPRSRVG